MTTGGNYIGIDKWVPFAVLDEGMVSFLEHGFANKEQLKEHLREYIKGENRVSKAASVGHNILSRPIDILEACRTALDRETYLRLPEGERKALLISLFACAYPIFYDLMVAMATALKVQSEINKKFMSHKMSSMYGSNRSFDMALDSLVIMIIELDIMKRNRTSIYSLSRLKEIRTPIVCEAYIYADIKMSGSKTILAEDIAVRPWYLYCQLEFDREIHTNLLQYSEGRLGGGYIGLRK